MSDLDILPRMEHEPCKNHLNGSMERSFSEASQTYRPSDISSLTTLHSFDFSFYNGTIRTRS
jgi:hypothetical protein